LKFDMHCHTKNGSIDSKVNLERYISLLKKKNFDGLMITDHDSYRGCRAWDKIKNDPKNKDFVVLKGIEYDTKDSGHILVIMPDNLYLPVLCLRGMALKRLIKIVHCFGGILGPAHPYGVESSSAMFFKKLRENPDIIRKFDFIETFNTCESPLSNIRAKALADDYGKPGIGGTDAHTEKYAGMACTEISVNIRSNNDFIRAVRSGAYINSSGSERKETIKSIHKSKRYAVWGFKAYNRGLGYLFSPYRSYKIKKLAI